MILLTGQPFAGSAFITPNSIWETIPRIKESKSRNVGVQLVVFRRPFVLRPPVVEHNRFSELIARVRNRDEEAARELAMHYQEAIRRAIRVQLRDAGMRRVLDSMDICQSVLASFFVRTALGQYELESPEKLLSLLTTIARNKLINQINRAVAQRRDMRRETTPGENAVEAMCHRSPDPAEQVSAREILGLVREKLGTEDRYLAEQREQGKSWGDLATELSTSEEALRKRLTRALDRVMTSLGLESHER